MKTIHGEEFLLISKWEYEKLLEEIRRLRRYEKENREWLADMVEKITMGNSIMIRDILDFTMKNTITIEDKIS